MKNRIPVAITAVLLVFSVGAIARDNAKFELVGGFSDVRRMVLALWFYEESTKVGFSGRYSQYEAPIRELANSDGAYISSEELSNISVAWQYSWLGAPRYGGMAVSNQNFDLPVFAN